MAKRVQLEGEPPVEVAELRAGTEPWTLFERADAERPVELEIGPGKGAFLLAAAERWPGHDFLAVEHARALAMKVAKRAERQERSNVRLAIGDAKELVRSLADASLHRVHVYCPDPWPKRKHHKHRLFAPRFAAELLRVMRPGGELLFTSDHDPYFREVVARLVGEPGWVRVTPEERFADIPVGGFDAIFEAGGVPVFEAAWQRVLDETSA
jgi:tRNA (guanine-N7-)-methyltransferase